MIFNLFDLHEELVFSSIKSASNRKIKWLQAEISRLQMFNSKSLTNQPRKRFCGDKKEILSSSFASLDDMF